MKKISLFILVVIFLSTNAFADRSITRGPDIGEIYYIGPTATGEGIYRSTDFGQTATCMDSTLNTNIYFMSIAADLNPGVLYGFAMPENLYISYNYGQQDSWIFRNSNISYRLTSGKTEGYIYNGKAKHSEDFGINFINHTCQGYFGDQEASEIDVQDDVGYALVSEYGVLDSLWLLISYDDFESLEIQHCFNWYSVFDYSLTRAYEAGELYLMKSAHYGDGSMVRELWFSNNFGENWVFKNHLLSNLMVGGRQSGELYILATYTQLMGEIKHTYIYHSSDYGETFTVYHPLSHGPEPYYANFEAEPTTGTAPLTVQFIDLSSGADIQNWEWDFNNDGVIDSYEQNPEYTYQDTGYYSVKLKIYYGPLEDGYIKSNYIHVTNGNAVENNELEIIDFELSNYPNPFNPITAISYRLPSNTKNAIIEIYNLKGQLLDEIPVSNQQAVVNWNAEDHSSGIYLYKLNIENTPIKKMILLK